MPPTNIFADIPAEGESPLLMNKVDTTTPESQTEIKEPVKEVEKQPEQEKEDNVPFHKHPRWKQMYDEREEYKHKLEDTSKQLEELSKWKNEIVETTKQIELPDWWKQAYGTEDASVQAYKSYSQNNRQDREQIKQELFEEMRKEQQFIVQKQEESTKRINENFDLLKSENPEADKNELFKFISDFQGKYGHEALVDRKTGEYDLNKSFELMRSMNPKTPDKTVEAKKEVAALSTSSRSGSTRTDIPNVSIRDLRNGNWREILKSNN